MDSSDFDKIKAIEKSLLESKPWQLKGEVGAHARPTNSLLFQDVQFEQRIRAPEITEETAQTLETIIKQRIKDAKFDDPVRKVKENVQAAGSNQVQVSGEKSKVGLAQLYEHELLSKVSQPKASDGPEKIVERRLAALYRKLDALCN